MNKKAFALLMLAVVIFSAVGIGTATMVEAKHDQGYGHPSTTSIPTLTPICSETDIAVDVAKVGSDMHVFQRWYDSATHALKHSVDLTPELHGEASFPAVDGCIVAFVFKGDIYIVRTTGGQPFQVTHSVAQENHPDWTTLGKIVYDSSDGYIYEVNPDGTGVRQISVGNNPVIFPDGTKALSVGSKLIFIRNGTEYETTLNVVPVAWTYSGIIVKDGEILKLVTFPSGKIISMTKEMNDFVSDPALGSPQIGGLGVFLNSQLNWISPQLNLVKANEPDWWKKTVAFDQAAFTDYLATLK